MKKMLDMHKINISEIWPWDSNISLFMCHLSNKCWTSLITQEHTYLQILTLFRPIIYLF